MYSQAEFELKNVPGKKDEFVNVVQRKQISSAERPPEGLSLDDLRDFCWHLRLQLFQQTCGSCGPPTRFSPTRSRNRASRSSARGRTIRSSRLLPIPCSCPLLHLTTRGLHRFRVCWEFGRCVDTRSSTLAKMLGYVIGIWVSSHTLLMTEQTYLELRCTGTPSLRTVLFRRGCPPGCDKPCGLELHYPTTFPWHWVPCCTPQRPSVSSRLLATACWVSRMVDIGIVVPEIDIFASSTGELNIITLDHMKKLKNVLPLETPDTLTTIDLAGSEGLEGMRIDTVKPQKIVLVFPFSHGVIVFMCAQS